MATKSQILRKEQVVSALIETRQNILAKARLLSEEQQSQVFLGIWSMEEMLAHLIGWDHTNLDAVRHVRSGKLPAFYEHRDPDWQTYNAMLVKKYKTNSFEDLVKKANTSQERLVQFLQTIPPEYFNKDFGVRFRGYKVTIQRLLEAEQKDEETHLQQIRAFFKESA